MSETEKRIGKSSVRVCVVNPNFYRSSGITVLIRRIYAATTKLDVEQFFVSCEYGGGEEDTEWVPTERFASFRLMDSNPIVVATELGAFVAWLRRRQIPVIHVYHRRLAVVLCAFKAFLGYRVIYTGQLTYQFAVWFWPIRPDLATAISESVARNMRATTRIRDARIVSNPADFSKQFHSTGEAEVDAVCIARLEPVKGHDHLIRAWKILRDQGYQAKLAFVGEGSLREHLEALVSDLGLGDLIEFRGFRADVQSEILRSRFGVLASSVEGQPLAVLEASACGRASLLTDVDGSRDCLPPNRKLPNGVPFGNASALASALSSWLANLQAVVEEGQVFFRFLQQTSSMEVVGHRYAELYREVGVENPVGLS